MLVPVHTATASNAIVRGSAVGSSGVVSHRSTLLHPRPPRTVTIHFPVAGSFRTQSTLCENEMCLNNPCVSANRFMYVMYSSADQNFGSASFPSLWSDHAVNNDDVVKIVFW